MPTGAVGGSAGDTPVPGSTAWRLSAPKLPQGHLVQPLVLCARRSEVAPEEDDRILGNRWCRLGHSRPAERVSGQSGIFRSAVPAGGYVSIQDVSAALMTAPRWHRQNRML